jgi:hypothetical protein
VVTLVARNVNEATVVSGSMAPGGQFCVGAFDMNLTYSSREDVFTYNLFLKESL